MNSPDLHSKNFFLHTIFFFAAGIGAGYYFPNLDNRLLLLFILSLLLAYVWSSRVQAVALCSCLILLLFGANGAFIAKRELQNQPALPAELQRSSEPADCVIVGRLAEMILNRADHRVLILANPRAQFQTDTPFKALPGKLLLRVKNKDKINLVPGDLLATKAQLKLPASINSPGVFDYPQYLAQKGIYLIGTIKSEYLIQPIATERSLLESIQFSIERFRTRISDTIRKLADTEASAIYQAILTGDRSLIPTSVLDGFKHTGTMHILAISGVHMSLLGVMLFKLFYWCLRRSQRLIYLLDVKVTALVLTLPFLALYTGIAGANPPVIRSFIMSLFCILALYVGHLKSALFILAAAAFIVLSIEPAALFSASFQLSYGAVAFILVLTPATSRFIIDKLGCLPLTSADRSWHHWPIHLISATLAATLGTAPLLIYHFNHISFSTIISNLLIEPLICLISLPLGFISLPLLLIHEPSALLLLKAGSIPLSLAIKIVSLISAVPGSYAWIPDPPLFTILLYYLACGIIINMKKTRYTLMGAILLCISVTSFFTPFIPWSGFRQTTNSVSFLNLGHGSGALIELSNGNTILIDGGSRSGSGFDPGNRVISPYLWHRGIARLDDVIITHADADHYNGLPTVMAQFSPKRLWLPETADRSSPTYAQLIATAIALNIEIHYPEAGLIYHHDQNRVYSLGRFNSVEAPATSNNRSLLIYLVGQEFSVLFPGDIEAAAEQRFVQSQKHIKPTILLSPHHGRKSSNSYQFLKTLAPDVLVISAAQGAIVSGTTQRTKAYAAQLGIPVVTTAEQGTIRFTWPNKAGSNNGRIYQQVNQ